MLRVGRTKVLLLGAGATLADAAAIRAKRDRPPVDRGFFSVAARAAPSDLRPATVRTYFLETYGIDILERDEDSLEGVMARLYPDVFNELLEERAIDAFLALIQLFTDRLALTTNDLAPARRRPLYRLLEDLMRDCDPGDVTIVTFNHDLHVEKTLQLLAEAQSSQQRGVQTFAFPELYGVSTSSWDAISAPTNRPRRSDDLFPRNGFGGFEGDCLSVLKLHGSLNWYSKHETSFPSREEMFDPRRTLAVTRRKTISRRMTLRAREESERPYTLPVIIPPVNHKSSVLPDALKRIWTFAEERLEQADDIVVFGYSCPALDFEAANLLARACRKRPGGATFSVIDPDAGVAQRYIKLLRAQELHYYASAQAFLASH